MYREDDAEGEEINLINVNCFRKKKPRFLAN